MRRIRQESVIGLLLALSCSQGVAGMMDGLTRWLDPERGAIDRRLVEISKALATLPPPSRTPGYINQGFIMTPTLPGSEPPWLEVTLPEPHLVDTVVLFPRVLLGSTQPIEGFGFPKRFRVTATAKDAVTRLEVADMTREDFPNPGITPVVIPGPRRSVSSVRLEVVKSWQDDVMSILALGEIMLLDGNRNVAVGGTVTVSHPQRNLQISEIQVIDMRTPLGLPVVNDAFGSLGYQSRAESSGAVPKAVTIDLGEPGTIDEVRLVPVSREGPLSYASFGFPPLYTVHASATADFAEARSLTPEPPQAEVAPEDNVVVVPCRHGEPFRYVRITATRLWPQWLVFLFALSEVQVYRGDTNVAFGRPVEATDVVDEPGWSPAALTDGYASGNRLIELPDWIRKLQQRDGTLAEQKTLLERREILRARDAARARIASIALGTCAVAVTGGFLFWQRRRLQLESLRMREQIARDLHDDIGSNVASISLISRLLVEQCQRPDADMAATLEDLTAIEKIASESTASMRDMVEMMAPRVAVDREDWVNVIIDVSRRSLRDARVVVETSLDDRAPVPDLATRREVYLAAKEIISNVAKHARAKEVGLRIKVDAQSIELIIKDNGIGFDPKRASSGHGLANIATRAAKLDGSMTIESASGAGTTIRFRVPLGRRRLTA